MNNIFVLQVIYGQPMPRLDKPVGVIYNNDDSYVVVFADTIDIAESIVVDDSLFGIVTIGDVAYEGYYIQVPYSLEEDFNDDTPDYERYWEADRNPD